jgi:hypothetical protein
VFPYQDEAGEAAAVKQIRAPFHVQFDRVEKDAAARAKALHAKYDQALAQAQAQLTQKQRLDDAVLVQKKREEIAAAWLRAGVGAAPAAGAPADDLLAKLTRTSWSWETVKGKNAISFARDGTFVFRGGTGVFQMEGNVVTVQLANRPHVLTFDFDKGEYTGYDPLLKQVITGHRTVPAVSAATPVAATAKVMATPAPATPVPKVGATPETKSAFDDAQMQKLTRGAWTWETPTARSTIKFAKNGICVHTAFNGTFDLRKDNTVVVHMANGRDEILFFDFNKGDYSGYDAVLKQKITGKRIR